MVIYVCALEIVELVVIVIDSPVKLTLEGSSAVLVLKIGKLSRKPFLCGGRDEDRLARLVLVAGKAHLERRITDVLCLSAVDRLHHHRERDLDIAILCGSDLL